MKTARSSIVLSAALCAVSVVAACNSGNGNQATLPIVTVDSQLVYAINTAPRNAPTAVYLYSAALGTAAVSASSDFSFDVAFDIDNTGHVVFLPVRTVASGLAGTHSVGLQVIDKPFDSLTFAPNKSYKYDSTLVVGVGDVVAVQSVGSACSPSLYANPYIYGKITVDSLDRTAGTMRLRFTVDPNCGFRTLSSGIPKN